MWLVSPYREPSVATPITRCSPRVQHCAMRVPYSHHMMRPHSFTQDPIPLGQVLDYGLLQSVPSSGHIGKEN